METTTPNIDVLSLSDLFTLITNVIIMLSTSLLSLLAVPAFIVLVVHFVSKEQKTKEVTKKLLLGYGIVGVVALATVFVRVFILGILG